MHIALLHRDESHHADLSEAVVRRAQRLLGRITCRVAALTVSIIDLNGPKGGIDRQCRVEARLHDGDLLHVQARSAEVGKALDSALHKLARRIVRERQRSIDSRRHALPLSRIAALNA